ncbi:uncharacterized protein [Leptinotarsa decemlineata]|uniref:uncharacterized protein n=1 Tax=Leptinotarsa decemlineata TaxID=7539 RepID=UPI003D30AFD8
MSAQNLHVNFSIVHHVPTSKQEWKQIAQDFYDQRNFLNCLGAIDGKHVAIKKPHNSGSLYYKYKKFFSIVMMAVTNANYEFMMVDIGVNGRISDGGVISYMKFGQALAGDTLKIPEPTQLSNSHKKFPFGFLGDDVFGLTENGRENYSDWVFAIENFLVLEGLSKCISEVVVEDDAKAKAKLVLTIDPSLYVHVKEAKTIKDLCDKLKSMFDDSGFAKRINLLRSLISIRLENCDSMGKYVNQIVENGQKLLGTGFKIDDEWIGSLLLAGLPEKYSPMIMAIEHSGIAISTDAIRTKLLDMEVSSISATVLFFLNDAFGKYDWYVDSGASYKLTANEELLSNVPNNTITKHITVANNTQLTLKMYSYVPGLTTNLLSVSQMIRNGNSVEFQENCCRIFNKEGLLVATADMTDGVYKLNVHKDKCLLAGTAVSGDVWHRRFGHINSEYLNEMKNGIVKDIDYTGTVEISSQNCIVCCEGILEKRFWAEAAHTAEYLRNRSIASGISVTPYQLWIEEKPDVSGLRIFRSTVMVHVPKENRLKWDKKAEYIFVGYSDNVKDYRVYNPKKNIVIVSRDVIFMEKLNNDVSINAIEDNKNDTGREKDSVG